MEWNDTSAETGTGRVTSAAGHAGSLPQCYGQPHNPCPAAFDNSHHLNFLSSYICGPHRCYVKLFSVLLGKIVCALRCRKCVGECGDDRKIFMCLWKVCLQEAWIPHLVSVRC